MLANAASLRNTLRITVLDSVTRASSANNNNGVPINCDQLTFDAYCRSTSSVPLVSSLLVQEGDEAPFWITCTIESRFSRCRPMPKGATLDARREKKGITVYYEDDKGKERKQLYTLVPADAKVNTVTAAAIVATQPVPAAPVKAVQAPVPPVPHATAAMQNTPAPAAAPVQNAPTPAAAPMQTSAQNAAAPGPGWVRTASPEKVSPEKSSPEKVRCNFSSTPSGAEITVDGKYVGDTPSEVGLSAGTHTVVVSIAGFAQWKRELAVQPDSKLNVSAVLQKEQQ
jgi:hypothetical protein